MIMYRQNIIIDEIVTRIMQTESPIELDELTDGEEETETRGDPGNHHWLYTVTNKADILTLQQAFEQIDTLYIADGHHRTAAACKIQQSPRPNSGRKTWSNNNGSRFITALIFPDTQLNVLSFNRCVKSLEGYTESTFLEAIASHFTVTKLTPDPTVVSASSSGNGTTSTHDIQMYLNHQWYQLTLLTATDSDTDNDTDHAIDAQILVEHLFKPILSMYYPDSEKNMIYSKCYSAIVLSLVYINSMMCCSIVDGRKGKEAIEYCVDSNEAMVGFTVARVSTRMIMKIADADCLLPPKATFFDPKPMPGLLLRLKR